MHMHMHGAAGYVHACICIASVLYSGTFSLRTSESRTPLYKSKTLPVYLFSQYIACCPSYMYMYIEKCTKQPLKYYKDNIFNQDTSCDPDLGCP